jgi:hypothetical protein
LAGFLSHTGHFVTFLEDLKKLQISQRTAAAAEEMTNIAG